MAEIIEFKKSASKQILEDLLELIKEDRVNELVLMYRVKHTSKQEEETWGGSARTVHHWFGEDSTLLCLGMARHLCSMIERYFEEAVNTIEEEE